MTDSKKLKIAMFTGIFPIYSETFITRKVDYLTRQGHDVHLFCYNFDRSMPHSGTYEKIVHLLEDVQFANFSKASFFSQTWDVVHCHFLVHVAMLQNIHHEISCPVIASIYGYDATVFPYSSQEQFAMTQEWIKQVDGLIYCCKFLQSEIQKIASTEGLAESVIFSETPTDFFSPRIREKPHTPLRILTVGRLHWSKGHPVALKAVEILRERKIDFRYQIIGEGETREELEYIIRNRNLQDYVSLAGKKTPKEVMEAMQWADIFLLSSTREAFGGVLPEAQASGLPVVASRIGGLPESTCENQTSLLVDPGNPVAFADALEKLCRDTSLFHRMSCQAPVFAKKFDTDESGKKLEQYYHQCIEHFRTNGKKAHIDLLRPVPPPSPKPESLRFAQNVKKINRKIMRPIENFLKATNRKILRPVENSIRTLRGKPKKSHPLPVLSQTAPIAPMPSIQPQSAPIPHEFQPPVLTIPWNGPTHDPLVFTQQQRESLHPLTYQLDILSFAARYIDFRGKTVLEIGGSNLPRDLVFGILGAKKWICVELLDFREDWDRRTGLLASGETIYPLNHSDSKKIIQDNDYVVFDGSATEIGEELHEVFDACVSICAFEHIHGLHKAVDGIYHALKNYGIFYTQFGPIWSGEVGHHFAVVPTHKYHFNKSKECHVPPFVHLLYSASEIDKLLAPYYITEEDIRIKNEIVKQCTDGTSSNRLFYEDFFDIMKDSAFSKISVVPTWDSVLDETTWLQLCRLYPSYRSFNVNSIQIVAQKQNN